MGRGLGIALLVLAATAMGVIARPASASSSREDHLRAEIAQLLNGERGNRGVRLLPVDGGLQQRAQAAAERNRAAGCEPPTDCHSPDAEAEILAWGGQESKTGAIVVAWMQSDTHRDILLHSQATMVGVGLACSGDGTVYVAVQFGGSRKPVPTTPPDPVKSSADSGSACTGAAVPLSQTAPPPTTSTTPPAPPPTAPPATSAPQKAPVVTRPPAPVATPAAPVTTVPTLPPTTVPATTTTTAAPTIVLSARTSEITAPSYEDEMALSVEGGGSGGRAEPAWIAMVMVVVFLSTLRIGFQLRDAAAARSKANL